LIRPLTLGNTTFPVNLIQGPLAGISCAPFRMLTWRYSRPAFSCTEMISCKTIIHQPEHAKLRYIHKDPEEGPVCFQLSGTDPVELGEAVKRVTAYGADVIDLNCGCPVKKIRSRGAGSKLLTNPALLYQLIRAMKMNTHVPVSIKIRVDHEDEKFNEQVAQVVAEAGADFLVVHGRHWTQHYETPCRHDAIKFFVETMKIPVIGNGDVACKDSLQAMLATGCAGVMVGRAGVGQPWLIGQLQAAINQEEVVLPLMRERGEVLLQHVERLVELMQSEKFAIIQARKFAKYYARQMPLRQEFHEAVNQCEDLVSFAKLCQSYFV
jgi:tRNA-dihydrouridine synthase B